MKADNAPTAPLKVLWLPPSPTFLPLARRACWVPGCEGLPNLAGLRTPQALVGGRAVTPKDAQALTPKPDIAEGESGNYSADWTGSHT